MSERDSDSTNVRNHALARIAALQRLREQLKDRKQHDMLRSVEQMIEHESKALRKKPDRDAEPRE